MATLLVSELAREHAASNRRVAQSVQAEARRLEEVGQPGIDVANLTRRGTRGAREALRITRAKAAEARQLWDAGMAFFEDGLAGDEARGLIQAFADFFDSWFDLAAATRDYVHHTAAQAGVSPAGEEDLDTACRDVEALRKAAAELRDFLNRPLAPVDPAALERAREAVAQGRYQTPEAVRSRIRSRP